MVTYNPAGYRNYIRFSRNKHILVEGKTDKVAFTYLLDELQQKGNVEVETAENLIKFEDNFGNVIAKGNRDKVEFVSHSIVDQSRNIVNRGEKSYAEKFIGFADRELREFKIDKPVQDLLNDHKIENRLVWSRGHSIENYLLDLEILSDPINIISPDFSTHGQEILESIWLSMLRLSCAATLTAFQTEELSLIKRSINWEILEIDQTYIRLNFDLWKHNLLDSNLNEDEVNEIIGYFNYWTKVFDTIELPLLRWICHGHIVFHILWNSIAVCIFVQSNDRTLTRKVLRDEEYRYNSCAYSWSRSINHDYCEYPSQVFELLGL